MSFFDVNPMSKYANAKIYKIVNYVTNDVYYGSTTYPLCKRLVNHKAKYKRWLCDKTNPYYTSFEILKDDDYKIILVEKYPCEGKNELEKREGEYIKINPCVNDNIVGQTPKEWYEKNRTNMNQFCKDYYKKNADAIKAKKAEKKECAVCQCYHRHDMTKNHFKSNIHQSNIGKYATLVEN